MTAYRLTEFTSPAPEKVAIAMTAAMTCNKEAFGELVSAGVVDGQSIASRSGDKVFSF